MKSALIVRHVPYEGCAGYRAPVEAAGYVIDRIDVTDPAFATADLTAPDLLIVMGGPMGVYDVVDHPWIPGAIGAAGGAGIAAATGGNVEKGAAVGGVGGAVVGTVADD